MIALISIWCTLNIQLLYSCSVQELRNDAELQEGNLGWLKTRMAALIEICADSDGQKQGSALNKLSADFKGLLTSLLEVGDVH